jgi:hypothetical protein
MFESKENNTQISTLQRVRIMMINSNMSWRPLPNIDAPAMQTYLVNAKVTHMLKIEVLMQK